MRLLLLCVLIVSCSTNEKIEKRDLDQLYIGVGVEQYFLAELPLWSHFSSTAKCRIAKPIRYLNFENLYRSYALDYEKLVQFQYSFNKKIDEYKKKKDRKSILLQDEAFLFYNTQEQILGGARDFVIPSYKRVNLIWIDHALSNPSIKERLGRFMRSQEATRGHPIFISRCLNQNELAQFINKNSWEEFGIRTISSSFFSPYNSFMKLGVQFEVNIDKILPNKEIHFYGPSKPGFIKGKMNVHEI